MIHSWSFAITPHCEWIGTKASNFGQVYFMWKKYFKIDNRECVTIEQHDEMAGLGRWADRVDSDTPDMEPVPCLVTVNPQQQWKGCGRCGGAVVGLTSCCWRCGMPATARQQHTMELQQTLSIMTAARRCTPPPPPQLQSLVLLLLLLCGFHPVAALLCLCRRAPGDSTPYLVELEKGPSEGL